MDLVNLEQGETRTRKVGTWPSPRWAMANFLRQLGFLRDARDLGLEPGFQRGDDGCRMLAPSGKTHGSLLPSDGLLDLIQQRDLAQHLLGDGRTVVLDAFGEATADMGPAVHQPPRAIVARDLSQRVVGLVGIALQEPALKTGKEFQRMRLTSAGSVIE